MDGATVAQWGATVVIAIGLCYTIFLNKEKHSSNETRKSTKLEGQINNIEKQINHEDYGLSNIKRSVDEQRLNCARISTSYSEKIDAAENDIKELKECKSQPLPDK